MDPQIFITSCMIIFMMSFKDQKLFIINVGMTDSDKSMDFVVSDSESNNLQLTSLSSAGDEEVLLTSGPSTEILPYCFEQA